MMNFPQKILLQILEARYLWLLLDYDGTLADFAQTPDDVNPDPELIRLLKSLAEHPKITLGIISGRRLSHIEKLVPISGIWLAGSYGLDIRTPEGEQIQQADYDQIRPKIEKLKPAWAKLIAGKEGFYLEDKGWSIALHARFAEDDITDTILSQARLVAKKIALGNKLMLLGGHKFLEIAPTRADKGKTISFLLKKASKDQMLPIFIGDDDKDERAFPVVRDHGGFAGCVCDSMRTTSANFYLSSPQETRNWLSELLELIR